MRRISLLLMILLALSCSSDNAPKIKSRPHPHYKGVDSRAQSLLDEYIKLANQNNIKFTKPISIGFTKIKEEQVVGICYYGKDFREVEIDLTEWNDRSEITRKSLLFHEFTHCLCSRDHDYSDGKKYPAIDVDRLFGFIEKLPFFRPKPGYYVDGCPLSIMHPQVITDDCMNDHKKEYMGEMFHRCRPY